MSRPDLIFTSPFAREVCDLLTVTMPYRRVRRMGSWLRDATLLPDTRTYVTHEDHVPRVYYRGLAVAAMVNDLEHGCQQYTADMTPLTGFRLLDVDYTPHVLDCTTALDALLDVHDDDALTFPTPQAADGTRLLLSNLFNSFKDLCA